MGRVNERTHRRNQPTSSSIPLHLGFTTDIDAKSVVCSCLRLTTLVVSTPAHYLDGAVLPVYEITPRNLHVELEMMRGCQCHSTTGTVLPALYNLQIFCRPVSVEL